MTCRDKKSDNSMEALLSDISDKDRIISFL